MKVFQTLWFYQETGWQEHWTSTLFGSLDHSQAGRKKILFLFIYLFIYIDLFSEQFYIMKKPKEEGKNDLDMLVD